MKKLLTVALLLLITVITQGEEADPTSEKALEDTIELLLSQEKRQGVVDKDAKAKGADDFALQVGGNAANQQKIYELSAEVMRTLAKEGKNDPDAMMKILEAGQKDPEGFAKKFTPEQQKALKELGLAIEKTKGTTKVP